mmetsp:Transcript_7016/g.9734  ORF Transcript_7016/g.9734 Transcript_7016/m.9734 type:complete len:717 (+) Transcript_7016:485-2635(+)|eukprot:CAMPEP_0184479994 /NCGR_PEP_ID=MMETSP0113_2-20130426/1489_1 /TAXON_ID=91329 /ORGANISM="Norrisiella sphaerica, Strain BC52" /LENGTH=716 /DNA_ID=CAMNT_0026858175 /DNA_START=481 /DNA_END=2631 /DNA_ORIENTATION=-
MGQCHSDNGKGTDSVTEGERTQKLTVPEKPSPGQEVKTPLKSKEAPEPPELSGPKLELGGDAESEKPREDNIKAVKLEEKKNAKEIEKPEPTLPRRQPPVLRSKSEKPGGTLSSQRRLHRKTPPTLDLHLSRLPQPIAGCELSPIYTHGGTCKRPDVVTWLRRPAGETKAWQTLKRGWNYTPTNADLNYHLRVEFQMNGRHYAEESAVVLPAPDPPQSRNWIRKPVKRKQVRKYREGTEYEVWRILSWNTLADQATNSWDKACESAHMLMWDYRIRNLLTHIRTQDADILCLQEIDKHHQDVWWAASLIEYGSRYAGGKYGCMLFYKKSKFALVQETQICFETELEDLLKDETKKVCAANPEIEMEIWESYHKLMINRKGLIVELEPITEGLQDDDASDDQTEHDQKESDENQPRENNLFVATIHLYKSDKRKAPFIRLMQIHVVLKVLEKLTKEVKHPKIVIAGDFNSQPDSCVCKFVREGNISVDHPELKDCTFLKYVKPELQHQLKLTSSYKEILGKEESYCRHSETPEPVVEYIWYSSNDDFQAQGVIPLPEGEKLQYPQIKSISSDHQLLVSEFATNRIVKKKNRSVIPSSFLAQPRHRLVQHQYTHSAPLAIAQLNSGGDEANSTPRGEVPLKRDYDNPVEAASLRGRSNISTQNGGAKSAVAPQGKMSRFRNVVAAQQGSMYSPRAAARKKAAGGWGSPATAQGRRGGF